jgi:hypothetical protein
VLDSGFSKFQMMASNHIQDAKKKVTRIVKAQANNKKCAGEYL